MKKLFSTIFCLVLVLALSSCSGLLERFESTYEMIIFSRSTNEIAIKNFLRHSIVKGGKPVED
ncbi:MAG: hypothetical protein II377_00160, partial [Clostridia bacterium]|nr:hypothetical protein [Clostridia bacterium]